MKREQVQYRGAIFLNDFTTNSNGFVRLAIANGVDHVVSSAYQLIHFVARLHGALCR